MKHAAQLFPSALQVSRPAQLAPTRTDPALPCCPVCGAAGIQGYTFVTWAHMAHDCTCDLTAPTVYDAGLRQIAQRRNAQPDFIASLPERYQGYTAASLRQHEGNARALAHLRGDDLGKSNLYLYGPAGTGKTHAAVAAARRLAAGGMTARFWGMATLIKVLRESNVPGSGVARPELYHWDALVLDDIDKIKPTAYVYEVFYELIEARWAARKVTIFTAQGNPNTAAQMLTPQGAETAADPLSSRMADGAHFKITGPDGRGGS